MKDRLKLFRWHRRPVLPGRDRCFPWGGLEVMSASYPFILNNASNKGLTNHEGGFSLSGMQRTRALRMIVYSRFSFTVAIFPNFIQLRTVFSGTSWASAHS